MFKNFTSLKRYYSFLSAISILVLAGGLFYFLKPYLPSTIFVENTNGNAVVMDNMMLKAATNADSIALKRQKDSVLKSLELLEEVENSFITAAEFDLAVQPVIDATASDKLPESLLMNSYTGSKHLETFYNKLYRIKNGSGEKLRIAYYGDSMIDGDLIVQDLRVLFQENFGGNGVGFVPIYSESSAGRFSIKTATTGNWDKKDFMKGNSTGTGVSGDLFYPLDSIVSVTYRSGGVKHSYNLNKPVLYYGKGDENAKIQIARNGVIDSTFILLKGAGAINTLSLSTQPLKSISVRFINAKTVPVYGVDFSKESGVTIDCFSKRGNSGLPLSSLSTARLNAFNETLKYDLVIMQYGANVLTTKRSNYDWYAEKMAIVVARLKSDFPGAAVLILGTADRGTKQGTQIATDTSVITLAASQQYAAWQSQAGFISLLHLMGGANTMSLWNSHKPKLANDDFTHFSPAGSKEVASRLYGALMKQYKIVEAREKAQRSNQSQINGIIQPNEGH
jgi:lysophospholipase L1-like esterase